MNEVDPTTEGTAGPAGTPPAPGQRDPLTVDVLARQVRTQRNWLIALSVWAALTLAVAACGIVGTVSMMGLAESVFSGPESEDVATDISAEIKDALGNDLASSSVRQVEVDEGVPFYAGWFDGGFGEGFAVEYSIEGSDVTIADIVSDPEELRYQGLIPTRGSLASRMTIEEFRALLDAWAAETSKPFGGVTRYGDVQYFGEGRSLPESVTVAGKEHSMKNLWAARIGTTTEDDTVDAETLWESSEVMVFSYDPVTGTFEYVATESGEMYDW